MVMLEDQALTERMRELLEDAAVPKAIHDLKSALHYFSDQFVERPIALAECCTIDAVFLPLGSDYSSHALPEVALRRLNLKLSASGGSGRYYRQAASTLRKEVDEQAWTPVTTQLMRRWCRAGPDGRAGVKIDLAVWTKCR